MTTRPDEFPPAYPDAALDAGALALGASHGDPDDPGGCGCANRRVHADWLEGDRSIAELVLDAAAPLIAAGERERWAAALAAHYLMGINCDHDNGQDNPMCGCSRVNLGWHPSAGEARQAWIRHVADLIGDH